MNMLQMESLLYRGFWGQVVLIFMEKSEEFVGSGSYEIVFSR